MFNPKHQKRMLLALGALLLCGTVVGVLLVTLQDNVQLYFTPTAISKGEAPVNRPIRIGGMVVEGTLERGNGLDVRFRLTDGISNVVVDYSGALPDLFREGQGVVAMGTLSRDGQLRAVQILAKHDENYMPKEVGANMQSLGSSNIIREGANGP